MAFSLVKGRLPINLWKTQCRLGYIVLLPEITHNENSFQTSLNTKELPNIKNLTTEDCISIVGKVAIDFESELWRIEEKCKSSSPNTFQDVLDPLERVSAPLDVVWGFMKTLFLTNSKLMTEECYMSIHHRALRARSQKYSNEKIYSVCKNQNLTELSEEKKRVVSKFILEGQLNGLELHNTDRIKLNSVLQNIKVEKAYFKAKVEVSTNKFKHTITDANIVRDFPENLMKAIAHDRSQYNHGPWTITLQPRIYSQFMEHCPNRDLRWNAWQANVRRSSNEGDRSLETSTHIEKLRSLRREQAGILGFESFAQMSMKTKMMSSVENIYKILERLQKKAFVAQNKEIKELEDFAAAHGFEGSLQIWDVPYWHQKQLRTLYKFDEEKLKEFFPLPKVLNELFSLACRVFKIEISQDSNSNVWHPDVLFFNVFVSGSTAPVGSFYFDPYRRQGERKGMQDESGWMIPVQNKSKVCEHRPLAALLFNFDPPTEVCPSLLTFKDVHQLFQKFGSALQHLLSTSSYSDVSGTSNIEWDAVEICSNFMTKWLCDAATVHRLSSHYKTQQPLPQEVLASLEQLPRLLAGYQLSQQLYLSALDLRLHSSKDFWLDIVRELWPQFFVFPLDKRDAHPCSFTAIFSGEWSSAYYCHLWAQVMAADVFSAFQDAGLNDEEKIADVGVRFRSTFLSLGGGCQPGEVFRRFRGRDPSPNALLYSMGLKQLPSVLGEVAA